MTKIFDDKCTELRIPTSILFTHPIPYFGVRSVITVLSDGMWYGDLRLSSYQSELPEYYVVTDIRLTADVVTLRRLLNRDAYVRKCWNSNPSWSETTARYLSGADNEYSLNFLKSLEEEVTEGDRMMAFFRGDTTW